MVLAGPMPGVTVTQVPPEKMKEPEPAVGYPSLRVACDSVAALTKRRLRIPLTRADGVPVAFGFGPANPPRLGCDCKAHGRFAPLPPVPDSVRPTTQSESESTALGHGFAAAGWTRMIHYQAGGPDGEVVGWRSKETTCVTRWSWDGGDDSDSTYVPSDEWDLVISCTPWDSIDAHP